MRRTQTLRAGAQGCAAEIAKRLESSWDRRLASDFGLTIAQLAIIRTAGPMQALPVYFVDSQLGASAPDAQPDGEG